ncbi:C_GCAxxG_C_C family protein [Desulfovibrio sp. X2]|uniref:C-GCAxxG-C-C family protein n=1 Tax=Desulfovibrio sp. X2 TaxID=941449 RepID=UPI000358D924|nr:C-GCAxxG-C-C family protein [Desulfovibrio sp. X2]EPR42832.1 C_GCAxxG_C_C family protein [Desulfovibrio sp. X2]
MSDVADRATGYWRSGWLCAESVSKALAEALGPDEDPEGLVDGPHLPRAASGFCSGLARTGGMCGALSGAVLVIGLARGRSSLRDSLDIPYALVQELREAFLAEFGSDNCAELTGCRLDTAEGQKTYKERGLRDALCPRLIAFAAERGLTLLRE